MGITGLIPFLEKASRKTNVSEFSGCTVAIDSYCWLHKGAFACADRLARGEETDIHINYCLKYVTMLLSKNIKPILVFDGRHLPAKALTELKRRESRDTSRKRAVELLQLGKTEEARSYIRRCVDITHHMALALIKECRKRNVDCIVAPYEADAQLAYLNVRNYAQLVITEDSDLILFGCSKVLFKMDLDGAGLLVETVKLPLVMKCPIEHYNFEKFRRMCIMSGCDYLPSLPGIGLVKARQFVTATQDSNFANALRKLPSFFNKSSLTVTDEYRESFLQAEATFKHQYVYDPVEREMIRLNEVDDEDIEKALCVNAGELLDPNTAFQLALGNIEPFTLKKLDNWNPNNDTQITESFKTNSWKEKGVSSHPSIWHKEFKQYLEESQPWLKKVKKQAPIIAVPTTRVRKKVVNLVSKYVEETQDQSLTIESLSSMYCTEPAIKKQKIVDSDIDENVTQFTQIEHDVAMIDNDLEIDSQDNSQKPKSPILMCKERSVKKMLQGSYSVLKKLSRFPRTTLDTDVVESKFFNSNSNKTEDSLNDSTVNKESNEFEENITEESVENTSRNPFKLKQEKPKVEIDSQCFEIPDSQLDSFEIKNSAHNVTQLSSFKSTMSSNTSTSNSVARLSSPKKKRNSYKNHMENISNKKRSMIKDNDDQEDIVKTNRNPFKLKQDKPKVEIDTQCFEIPDSQLDNSQKENSPQNSPVKKPSSFKSSTKRISHSEMSLENSVKESKHTKSIFEEKLRRNLLKLEQETSKAEIDTQCFEIGDSQFDRSSTKGSTLDSAIGLDSPKKRGSFYNNLVDKFSKTTNHKDSYNPVTILLDDSPIKGSVSPTKGVLSPTKRPLSPNNRPVSPILTPSYKFKNHIKTKQNESASLEINSSADSVIDSTYTMETFVESETTFSSSQVNLGQFSRSQPIKTSPVFKSYNKTSTVTKNGYFSTNASKKGCKVSGLRRTNSLPNNQPTLLNKFGFQRKPVLRKS